MRAVVYRGLGQVAVEHVPDPVLAAPTDAIVKVTLAGLCGTDLHALRGHFEGLEPGAVLGHEFVGEVVEAGPAVRRHRRGDAVLSADFTACGGCRVCERAEYWHCRERMFFGTGRAFGAPLEGAQAEYVRVPHADTTLGPLPTDCPPEAALLMADNLATGWVAIERAGTQPGESVAIVGGGAIGQLAALAAQAIGAGTVMVVEPHAARRAFAARIGAHAMAPDEAAARVRLLTGEEGADVVVEAVGGEAPMALAAGLLRPRGRLVSVGAHVTERWALPVARAFREEWSLSFAIGDAIRLRRRLLRLVTSGALDPTIVIDARGRLEDVPALYGRLAAQSILKAVVSP